jgi:putative ABC transport system permease protein
MTGSLNVGPRVMMSRAGLDRTGLISLGSRASERFLLRLPESGLDVQRVRNRLKRVFPEGTIADYRETHPVITRGLDRATTYLSLISLITLIVASLGVAIAIQSHLQQRMDTIAIMKCLGARASQILRISSRGISRWTWPDRSTGWPGPRAWESGCWRRCCSRCRRWLEFAPSGPR